MGCTSSNIVEIILKNHKEEIESAKKEIQEQKEKNTEICFSIIFKLMKGKSYTIQCFNNTKLFKLFLLLVDKAKDSDYSNLDKLKIYYNSKDITQYFNKDSNKDVSFLDFTNYYPVININN